ncbi:MAG TPA: hypothetical protein DCY07_08245 [Rhodospirillaceae bacterium]|nr:hypothetical protein [Rhodospirillaceae bacterium]
MMQEHCDHCESSPPSPHHHHGGGTSLFKTSAHATVHCLTGCVIGEVAGLAIGVHYGLGMWPTMILATVLAYITGFSLTVFPLMKSQALSFMAAMRAIWLGEAISIGVMEIVMNATDYMVGGVQAASLTSPLFYYGIAAAIPAGFLAAWPVNYLLIKNEVKKKCH